MLIFDQLKKNDAQLQVLAFVIFACLALLLAGLWWVQVVSAGEYRSSLEIQSYRTVRIPAVRGKILDRNGQVLAENRATFNISLYLEDLSASFRKEYKRSLPAATVTNSLPFWKRWLGFSPVNTKPVKLTPARKQDLEWQARYRVANNTLQKLSAGLQQPLALDTTNFQKHYESQRALPYPLIKAVSMTQIARFEEQFANNVAAYLEIQSTRVYPFGATASHVLGYLKKDDASAEGELAEFSYRLADVRGVVGIEGKFDGDLRGRAGAKSVLVNNLGYRQSEKVLDPAEAGRNVVLTLDLKIQREAEAALRRYASDHFGAVVVMEVETGDILALVSAPAMDPNYFITNFPPGAYQNWTNADVGLQKNRATWEVYQPGSTFKPIVALAALENGLNPNENYHVEPNPSEPNKGAFFLGKQKFRDTAAPGLYDLRRALVRSSNSYFITNGLRPGVFASVVEIVRRLHLAETNGLPLRQDSPGHFPTAERRRSNWGAGDIANISIGQGEMNGTPVHMAVLSCALANGGKVLWPRLVSRLESQDPASVEAPTLFPAGRVRDNLGVNPRHLQLVRDAMVAETEDNEGTGQHARLAGLRICGKTGTAERIVHGQKRNTTWFISFAPYEPPARYAIVVMVEDGTSGGATCAPVARDIYKKLFNLDQPAGNRTAVISTR